MTSDEMAGRCVLNAYDRLDELMAKAVKRPSQCEERLRAA